MALKGGTSACAACKYQRRKCIPECQLASYFPADQAKRFQNAHKLFGVSKIIKILENLSPAQKDEAMRSIIYQANIREKFPVHGCWEVICWLRFQIRIMEEELILVTQQLEFYRQQHNFNHHHQIASSLHHQNLDDDVTSQLELGMAPPTNNNNNNPNADAALSLFNQSGGPPLSYCSSSGMSVAAFASPLNSAPAYHLDSSKESNATAAATSSMWVPHNLYAKNNVQYNNYNTNSSSMAQAAATAAAAALQPLAIQQEVVQDDDDMHPFFDIIDDRQSYNDSKEAYDTSSEESLKDTTLSIEHVGENELKSAAACFSLTNAN